MVPDYMKALLEEVVNNDSQTNSITGTVELGFRWQIFPLGKHEMIPDDDKVQALHIECAKDHYWVVKEILVEVYCAAAKDFPSGIKL